MALTRTDLKQIGTTVKSAVVEAVDPYFVAIQKDFNNIQDNFKNVHQRFDKIDERFDKIERFLVMDHKRRIEKLEMEVKELRDLLAVK